MSQTTPLPPGYGSGLGPRRSSNISDQGMHFLRGRGRGAALWGGERGGAAAAAERWPSRAARRGGCAHHSIMLSFHPM